MEVVAKRCGRCREEKPVEAFYVKAKSVDGRQDRCSDCIRELAHIAYLKKMGIAETRKRRTIDSPVASKEGHRLCTKCGEEKPLEEFEIDKRKELGHTFRCKPCATATKKKWVDQGGDEYREKLAVYREENRDMLLEGKKRHYRENQAYYREKGKKHYLEHQEGYRQANRDKYQRNKHNPLALLPDKLRVKIKNILKGTRRTSKNDWLIGCSAADFRKHIQSLWKEGMTWENYGVGRLGDIAWQLDHIKPITAFDLSDSEQICKCFHYTNIQPLWWEENVSKSNKIT